MRILVLAIVLAVFGGLANNPELTFFKKTRTEMQQDPQYPAYHYLVPEHNSGDPNGLCYWQGNWHLFYQYRALNTPGLAVSPDLIHWQALPLSLWPTVGKQCFSGSALVEDDRVLVIYHATAAGNQIVKANDPLLLDWKYIGKNPGQEATIGYSPKDSNGYKTYSVWYPCMFKDGDMYYSVVGGSMYYTPAGNVMGPRPNLGSHLRRAT
ncbi:hypothetical protein HQ520_08840 [bacterium]|nr:hypothetical protein [bacterium]